MKGKLHDCGECKKRGLQEHRGCPDQDQGPRSEDRGSRRPLYTIDGVDYFTCPTGAVDWNLVNDAFALFNAFQRGFLPHAGGIYDQPEKLMQIIETVEGTLRENRKTS